MPISTGEDLKRYFNVELIENLVWDDPSDYSLQATLTHENVTTAIQTASGRILAALRQGNMYDIETFPGLLQAAGNEDALAFYKQIECLIAMSVLLRRKPTFGTPELRDPILGEADDYLEKLRTGVNVLGIQANINAGVATPVMMNEPEVFNIQSNTITTKTTGRLYPFRNS